jgi:hypothetical protein
MGLGAVVADALAEMFLLKRADKIRTEQITHHERREESDERAEGDVTEHIEGRKGVGALAKPD